MKKALSYRYDYFDPILNYRLMAFVRNDIGRLLSNQTASRHILSVLYIKHVFFILCTLARFQINILILNDKKTLFGF